MSITFNWYQSSYAIILFAAHNCRMSFSFTQEFRQPNFIIQFEINFQEFYSYDMALKYVVDTLLTACCIFSDTIGGRSLLVSFKMIIFSLAVNLCHSLYRIRSYT